MNLTPAETAIADLISDGLPNKEIASVIGISEATVKTHATRAMKKMHFTNRVQLALEIARRRWEAERAGEVAQAVEKKVPA